MKRRDLLVLFSVGGATLSSLLPLNALSKTKIDRSVQGVVVEDPNAYVEIDNPYSLKNSGLAFIDDSGKLEINLSRLNRNSKSCVPEVFQVQILDLDNDLEELDYKFWITHDFDSDVLDFFVDDTRNSIFGEENHISLGEKPRKVGVCIDLRGIDLGYNDDLSDYFGDLQFTLHVEKYPEIQDGCVECTSESSLVKYEWEDDEFIIEDGEKDDNIELIESSVETDEGGEPIEACLSTNYCNLDAVVKAGTEYETYEDVSGEVCVTGIEAENPGGETVTYAISNIRFFCNAPEDISVGNGKGKDRK